MAAFRALALEGFINGFAENFPQFLLGLAVQRHRLRLGLPALLQGLDGVHAQRGFGQCAGLGDQGMATLDAGFLCRLQTRRCSMDGGFPLGLQFGKGFFVQVPRIAPAVGKLVQRPHLQAPVAVVCMCFGPGLDLIQQAHALGLVGRRRLFGLLQPGLHRLVGLVAGRIKTLPQTVVGQTALIGLFPGLTQLAQTLLHLAAPRCGGLVGPQQGFGLGHQFQPLLVHHPALPALGIACRQQRRMHTGVQCGVQVFAMGLERLLQTGCGIGGHRAFGHGLFQGFQHLHDRLGGLFAQGLPLGGVQLGLGHFGGFVALRCSLGRGQLATDTPDFIGPDRHGWQSRLRIGSRQQRLLQCGRKAIPDRLQLAARSVHLGRELQIHTGPDRVLGERLGLVQPVPHIGLQSRLHGLGLGHGLGGLDLDALGQQDGGFLLHHHLVLQILHPLDHLGQPCLEAGQRFAGQWCTCLGGIALPGHGVGNVQARGLQQMLGTCRPVGSQGLLATAALEFIELLAQGLGGPLVAAGQLVVDLVHLLHRGLRQQPVAQAGAALARGGGRECATGQLVEGLEVNRFGGRSHGQMPERGTPQGQTDRRRSANGQRVFSPGFVRISVVHGTVWLCRPGDRLYSPEK